MHWLEFIRLKFIDLHMASNMIGMLFMRQQHEGIGAGVLWRVRGR